MINLMKVRGEIDKRGWKHRWLAKQIGVHPTTLSRFLNGKTVLSSESLMKLMSKLELKPETLMKKAS